MQITLKKPIKRGQSRVVTITTGHGVGRQPNGALVTSQVLDGDSSAPTVVEDASTTDKKITVRVYGDGSLGEKKVRLHLDTQSGKAVEGKPVHRLAQDVDILYTVGSPEVDEVKVHEGESADEDLPTTHQSSYMRH